jgi:hypothetical protein
METQFGNLSCHKVKEMTVESKLLTLCSALTTGEPCALRDGDNYEMPSDDSRRRFIPQSTDEPVYNDIALCDTSSIMSDILWYQLIPHC